MTKINDDESTRRVLGGCPLFSRLSPSSVESLVEAASWREFQADQTVFSQGDVCPGVFVVDKGVVRIFCDGTDGKRHILHLCGPGQSFAEVAVFADFALPASASSVQASRCVLVPAPAIQKLIATEHDFCRQMLAGMAFWTRHFTELLGDLVLLDSSERVMNYLSALPTNDQGFTVLPAAKKEIASHLNLSSETFSRALRHLKERGKIYRTTDHQIKIREGDTIDRLQNFN